MKADKERGPKRTRKNVEEERMAKKGHGGGRQTKKGGPKRTWKKVEEERRAKKGHGR